MSCDLIEIVLTPVTEADPDQRSGLLPPAPAAAVMVGVVALAETAWIHLKDLSDKFAETPYLGVGYAAIVVAAVAAGFLIVTGRRRGWALAGAMCLATIIGFVLTRTTGLPAATGDVGNWGEPAGIYALIAEGVVVTTSAYVLTRTYPRNH
jgi:hypothetical protein